MDTQDTLRKTGVFIRNSATIKIISIGILVLVLLIPSLMVSSLLKERQSRRDSVVEEINEKWGKSQTITGPFFTVPYKSYYKNAQGVLRYNTHFLHILPENIEITGKIDPHIRYRSIYEAVLYNTQIDIKGNFIIPSLHESNIDPKNVLWNKAIFSIGVSDMKGIQENIDITYNNKSYKASPGLKTRDVAPSGVRSVIPLSPTERDNTFTLRLNLNGSEQVHFIPVGETTRVDLESTWPSPSFNGTFLPTTREVSDEGFSATWNVLHLNRAFPQFWKGNNYNVTGSSFGLKLLITADIYQKSIRISKYALMFIIFTFAAFFLTETINKQRVHPIQYILVGLTIVLFYILLLSISEHINYDFAYIVSAVATTAVITAYSRAILGSNRFSITMCGILIILYGYLYIVLQLEDYALLMGSIGLFVVLVTVMYVTRKIDWYAPGNNQGFTLEVE
jgi:inner membrane protein